MDRTEANSLAGSCITSALLDVLLSKGILTLEETRAMLMKAQELAGTFPGGSQAGLVIGEFLRTRFPAHGET